MTDPARLARAAHNILTRSLGLRRDQNLLIFADASSLEVVEVMARAARDLGIATSTLFVPRVLQADTRAAREPAAAGRGRGPRIRCRAQLPLGSAGALQLPDAPPEFELEPPHEARPRAGHDAGDPGRGRHGLRRDRRARGAAVRRARPGETAGSGHRGRPRAGVPADRRDRRLELPARRERRRHPGRHVGQPAAGRSLRGAPRRRGTDRHQRLTARQAARLRAKS